MIQEKKVFHLCSAKMGAFFFSEEFLHAENNPLEFS
jgi:hypothetical protein